MNAVSLVNVLEYYFMIKLLSQTCLQVDILLNCILQIWAFVSPNVVLRHQVGSLLTLEVKLGLITQFTSDLLRSYPFLINFHIKK